MAPKMTWRVFFEVTSLDFFRGSLGEFGQISFAPPKMCLLLHLWVPWRLRYCKRVEIYFTTLLWQKNGRQNCLISRMSLSEFYKNVVNKDTFVSYRRCDLPNRPPSGSAPVLLPVLRTNTWPTNISFLITGLRQSKHRVFFPFGCF